MLLEGPHLVGAALDAGMTLDVVLATPAFLDGGAARVLVPRLFRPPLPTTPERLDELADADSPRGLVALARRAPRATSELPVVEEGLYVYLDGVQDPGNLGALARVAEATGASALCLSSGCANPDLPRALRASAGSILRLPCARGVDPDVLDDHLGRLSPRWVALAAHGGDAPESTDLSGTVIFALGAEGPGLSAAVAARAGSLITIPLAPPVESLNVTVAAAVVLFERFRHQRTRGLKPPVEYAPGT